MVTYSARSQLHMGKTFSLSLFAPDNLASRDRLGRPFLRQFAHSLHLLIGYKDVSCLTTGYSLSSFHYTVNRHRVSPELIRAPIAYSTAGIHHRQCTGIEIVALKVAGVTVLPFQVQ